MRDLEMSGGGAGYQMYDYSDSWGQGFGNNLYGQHRIGPGSGNYWSNGYVGANQNAAMMSTRTFNNHYRIRNDQDRAKLANNIGTNVYRNGSSTDWGRPEGTSGYGEGSLVNNKYGTWVLVNGSWVEMTSSDQMANRIAWAQQGGLDLTDPPNKESGPNWLSTFGSVVSIWGMATEISVNGLSLLT